MIASILRDVWRLLLCASGGCIVVISEGPSQCHAASIASDSLHAYGTILVTSIIGKPKFETMQLLENERMINVRDPVKIAEFLKVLSTAETLSLTWMPIGDRNTFLIVERDGKEVVRFVEGSDSVHFLNGRYVRFDEDIQPAVIALLSDNYAQDVHVWHMQKNAINLRRLFFDSLSKAPTVTDFMALVARQSICIREQFVRDTLYGGQPGLLLNLCDGSYLWVFYREEDLFKIEWSTLDWYHDEQGMILYKRPYRPRK